jgi:ABC-type nickel/cobalt efflux system permease component RcnA
MTQAAAVVLLPAKTVRCGGRVGWPRGRCCVARRPHVDEQKQERKVVEERTVNKGSAPSPPLCSLPRQQENAKKEHQKEKKVHFLRFFLSRCVYSFDICRERGETICMCVEHNRLTETHTHIQRERRPLKDEYTNKEECEHTHAPDVRQLTHRCSSTLSFGRRRRKGKMKSTQKQRG